MPSKREQKRHRQIKGALKCVGSSLSQISRELGVSASTVSAVSMGISRSRSVEEKIAQTLGTDVQTLWPERGGSK